MKPEELLHNLQEAGDDWADKRAAAEALEEGSRAFLAQLVVAYMTKGSSNAKAQEEARANKEYIKNRDKLVSAKNNANRAKITYDLCMVAVDLYRTDAATKRAELENLNIR